MNQVMQSNGRRFREHLYRRWDKLANALRDTIAGKRDRFAGRVHDTYGVTRDQAELQAKAFEEIRKGYQPKSPT